jgi:hypothetical protein
MSAPHSRGPWTLQPLTGSTSGNIGVRASGEHVSGYVAFVDTRWPHPEQQEEQIANARLIAAAPDLLNALQMIANFPITHPDENQDAANMAFIAREWINKVQRT